MQTYTDISRFTGLVHDKSQIHMHSNYSSCPIYPVLRITSAGKFIDFLKFILSDLIGK